MIKTQLDLADLPQILNLGRQFHQESHFNSTDYDEVKVRMLLEKTLELPHKLFLAYDDQFQGVILLQMATQFFNNQLWAGDQAFYVTPATRGRGLASDLLNAGQQWAKQEGASEVVILHNAGINADRAQSYYESKGFNLSGLIFRKSLIEE